MTMGAVFRRSVAAVIVALFGLRAQAEEVRYPPVDQGARDATFLAYRKALLHAVETRNVEKVVSLASKKIKLSFGGEYGRATLRKWLTVGARSEKPAFFWRELKNILRMGGVFERPGQFCTPYVSCMDVEVPGCPDCSGYDYVFVIREGAPAYEGMSQNSRVVARLSYNVLQIDDKESKPGWFAVKLPGGGGYMHEDDVRSPVDYRAYFEKYDGAWYMTVFIAGD